MSKHSNHTIGTSTTFTHTESKEDDSSFHWFTRGFCRPLSISSPNHDKPDLFYFEMFPHKLQSWMFCNFNDLHSVVQSSIPILSKKY